MRNLIFLLMIGMLIISCGSKIPITDSSKAISDDRILGFWNSENPENDEKIRCIILKFNDLEYFIELQSMDINEDRIELDTLYCRAYICQVGDKPFFNIQPIDTSSYLEREYFFYDYRFKGDSLLHIRELSNVDSIKINDFEKSSDLYNFIFENLENPLLYGEETTLKRAQGEK